MRCLAHTYCELNKKYQLERVEYSLELVIPDVRVGSNIIIRCAKNTSKVTVLKKLLCFALLRVQLRCIRTF